MQSVFGNVGTLIAFRVAEADASGFLEPLLSLYFDARDLTNLPNWQAAVRTTAAGQVMPPFTLSTFKPSQASRGGTAQEIRKRSQSLYGTPRAMVEEEISRSLEGRGSQDSRRVGRIGSGLAIQ